MKASRQRGTKRPRSRLVNATVPPARLVSALLSSLAEAHELYRALSAQMKRPLIVEVSFTTTQEVAVALHALRSTGLFGNGVDCASVAEELLRYALRQPDVIRHWISAKTSSAQNLAAARLNLRASAIEYANSQRRKR